ncbi:DNA double-strand break repair rad50 ATPase [Zea mays]|uniref:DNA double-strand break repair rad50 ATPase n=1 Tax=Zea mays TaxID=4577 RepID=A0A1D6M9Z8_MAIZE|nr:DNA double-strand break repair rad50 ATPase [Zea mays]
MALTNFILTVVGVGAAVMLLRKDVKQSATVFRRNVRHIRNWLEEESAAAANSAMHKSKQELKDNLLRIRD